MLHNVAIRCNIKKLKSKFCTSFLEVQIGYNTFIKMLYFPIINQKHKNLSSSLLKVYKDY